MERPIVIDERRQEVVQELMRNVYMWMTGGLALTGVIAWIVAMILGRPENIWMSAIGVLIFAGLTVYDAQKIRQLMLNEETINEGNMKLALLGALSLYLDFINILLRLLSLFGKRK